jgi:integrase
MRIRQLWMSNRLGAIVSVATALGLRQGEALGLRWQDVDSDGCTLSVRQALERSGGDSTARRPLAAERRELRKRIAVVPKRSQERRELWQELEANRSQISLTLNTYSHVLPALQAAAAAKLDAILSR